ncbi:MAG: hypothetical protein R2727_11965 [Bacteroidales bacterium]
MVILPVMASTREGKGEGFYLGWPGETSGRRVGKEISEAGVIREINRK